MLYYLNLTPWVFKWGIPSTESWTFTIWMVERGGGAFVVTVVPANKDRPFCQPKVVL